MLIENVDFVLLGSFKGCSMFGLGIMFFVFISEVFVDNGSDLVRKIGL